MQEMTFTVRILNEPLNAGEKIARIGNVEGTSLLRVASLSITPEKIQLICADDVGKNSTISNINQKDLRRIRIKKSVFTPGQQLIKPAVTGLISGIVVTIILFLRIGDRRVTGPAESIGIGILLVLFITVLFVAVNLGKVVWSNLAVIALESTDGKTIELAIEDERVDTLAVLFVQRGIPLEPL